MIMGVNASSGIDEIRLKIKVNWSVTDCNSYYPVQQRLDYGSGEITGFSDSGFINSISLVAGRVGVYKIKVIGVGYIGRAISVNVEYIEAPYSETAWIYG